MSNSMFQLIGSHIPWFWWLAPFPQHGMMHRQGEDKQFAVPPEARRLALMKLECSSPPKQLMRLLRIVDFA